jgi:hypothetical protein
MCVVRRASAPDCALPSVGRDSASAIGPKCGDETFRRLQRYDAMTQPDTWYVAFGPDRTVKSDSRATGPVRSTRTFKTEADAKAFAMEIIAKGWSATAGTLNPHQPKRIIGASQIEVWADPSR